MKAKSFFGLIVIIALLWCAVSAIKPFWNKFRLGQDVDTAATYGTKHTIEDTRKYLNELMEKKNHGFTAEDFTIEKDEDNYVTISITYEDEIRIFGATVMELEFTVEKSRAEVKQRF